MFKAKINANTSVSVNTNIPLTVLKNTTNDISYDSNSNTIIFNSPGHYKVDFHVVTTNVAAGDITISEVLNGTSSSVVLSTETSSATTDFITLDVPDLLSIYASQIGSKATISYQSTVSCTASTGIVTIVKLGR